MEALSIIAVLVLALLLVMGVLWLLLWAEKGVNDSNKKLDDEWQELKQSPKDTDRSKELSRH